MKIQASELPKNASGKIYHLGLFPEDIADNILLVGDPGRVPIISKHFDTLDFTNQNRELVTHTGTLNGNRITVISTGMGTDNIDIVLTELDALANIDLTKMEVRKERRVLNIIRIGTSGCLQPDIPNGSFIASKKGLGIDSILQFYQHEEMNDDLIEAFMQHTHWNERLSRPYCTNCSSLLFNKIAYDMYQGITITAPGFFGPQGRVVRAPLMYPNLNQLYSSFNFNGEKIVNFEMECSAIYGLSHIFGHNALTICLSIANRATTQSSTMNYEEQMEKLIQTILDRIF